MRTSSGRPAPEGASVVRSAGPKRFAVGLALAALLGSATAWAGDDSKPAQASAQPTPAASAVAPPATRKPAPHRGATVSRRAKEYYQAAWGVDRLKVSRTASGNLVRFTYRVTDPKQAAPLIDRNATPILYAQRTRAVLSVPVMEKIGPLRQVGAPKAGQELWVAFSNKGNLVKAGDRVNVIVGRFHADGLVVE